MVVGLFLLIVSRTLVPRFSELHLSRAAPQRTEPHISLHRVSVFEESDPIVFLLRPGFMGREREGSGELGMGASIDPAGLPLLSG